MKLQLLLVLLTGSCSQGTQADELVSRTAPSPGLLARPTPDEISDFVANPIPAGAGYSVTMSMMQDILRDYLTVDREHWHHAYSHIAGRDRTGHFATSRGENFNWMLRPGGLATLERTDGTIIYLASGRGMGVRVPSKSADD